MAKTYDQEPVGYYRAHGGIGGGHMAKPHDQESNCKGASMPGLRPGPYDSAPYAQEHGGRGLHPAFCPILGFLTLL
jgi:hypothetical protein